MTRVAAAKAAPAANLAPPQSFSAHQHARVREDAAHNAVRSGGMPLDTATRTLMERGLGHRFGDVRIHLDDRTTAAAQSLRARAYAIGSDIGFAPGKYRPDNSEGRALLAHELAHVVQQRSGAAGGGNEAELERNADRARDSVRKGVSFTGPFGRSAPRIARDGDAKPAAPEYVEYTGAGGAKVTVTRAEFDRLKQQAIQQLRGKLTSVEEYANAGKRAQEALVNPYQGKIESVTDLLSNPKAIFAIAVDMHAGIQPPYIGMWGHPVHLAQLGRAALDKGDLREGATDLQSAASAYRQCQSEWNAYVSATIAGGEKLITQLEVVRDVSFGIALAAGAAVAAPVIAAGVAGAGLTGVAGVAATGLVTGGVVSVGGAGLYGGAAAAGSLATHGKVDTAGVIKEAKRGLKDGFVTGLSAGVASGAGRALGLGAQGISKGVQMGRGAVASGAADAISGSVNAILQGKGAGDVLKAGGIGLGTGLVSGALGAGIKGPVLSKLAATAMGAGGGALATYASGGSSDDILMAAASGGASALALSGATPVHPGAQDKAFALGRSGARQARGVLAAAMVGTANAFPPAVTTGGPDFGKPTSALTVGAHADQPAGAPPRQAPDVEAPKRAATPPAHADAADPKPAAPPAHAEAADPKPAAPPMHADAADPKPAAPPAHADAADSKAAAPPAQAGSKRWRAAVEATVESAFGPDGATLPQQKAGAALPGHAEPAAPEAAAKSTAAPAIPAPGAGQAAAPSGTGSSSQPKYMEHDQAQNRPWSDLGILKALKQHINNYRRNSGIARVDLPETPGTAVTGGTVAVAKTDIPSLRSKAFGGASPEAIPERMKGKPGTTSTLLEPANPLSTNHAEAVALENLARELTSQIKSASPPDLKGKRVWVLVEQEPCASCASGIGSSAPPGPIKAFSEMFPDLIVEVHSLRSSRSYFIQNGKPVPGTQ